MKVKLTELNSGYKGQKKISNLSQQGKAKIIIALVLVAAFTVTFILSSVGIIPLDALFVRARVGVSGENDNLPIQIDSDKVLRLDTLGDSIVVITSDNLFIYSESGKQTLFYKHSMSNPALNIKSDKAIVYDRNGKNFVLIDNNEIIFEGLSDNKIITAQIGKDGSYALSTKVDGATSALVVHNKYNEKIFHWNCGFEYITSIAISDNGKYVGAAVLGAENGEIFTIVHHFGVEYKDELNSQKIYGVTPFGLNFANSNTLMLLSDSGIYEINKKDEKFTEILKYYSSEFNSCDIADNGKYIVTIAKYGSENVFETNLYSKNGKLKKTISTDFEIYSSAVTNKYIFIFGENIINVYNLSGKKVSEIIIDGGADSILPTDDFIFIPSLNKISRCFTYGDSTIQV